MPGTIDLNRAATSADAETFRAAVEAADRGARIAGGDFTASGDMKVPAPRKLKIGSEDFTATGMKPVS